MSDVLVTGANGQVGRELQLVAKKSPLSFAFMDHEGLDITDKSAVSNYFQQASFKYCINCAAYTDVNKAEEEREKAYAVNEEGVVHLAQACQQNDIWLIQPSTDFIFEGKQTTPYKEEDDPGTPLNIYGQSKYGGEQKALNYNQYTIVLRTSWVYSPFRSNFVKTMLKLGQEKEKLDVIYDQIGAPTYAHDLANVILIMIEQIRGGEVSNVRGVYHYSNEGVVSWYDFAWTIMDIAAINCPVHPVTSDKFPTPATRPHYSLMDKAKIKSTFGLEIPYWRESLRHCLERINLS